MGDPWRCGECGGALDDHREGCGLDLMPLPDEDLRALAGRASIHDIALEIISPLIDVILSDADVVLLLPRIVLALEAERDQQEGHT